MRFGSARESARYEETWQLLHSCRPIIFQTLRDFHAFVNSEWLSATICVRRLFSKAGLDVKFRYKGADMNQREK